MEKRCGPKFHVLCLLWFLLMVTCFADICQVQTVTNLDGYVLLEDSSEWRSTGYTMDINTEKANCDRFLDKRWYRISSKAGTIMPEVCPNAFECKTIFPMYLEGTQNGVSHPAVSADIVSRDVCIVNGIDPDNIDCCSIKIPIRIKNCGGFYVYELKPAPGCDMSYCFGTESACPQGLTSATGYTPCAVPFTNNCNSATVSVGTNTALTQIEFYCDFVCDAFTTGQATGAIQVNWYFSDVAVATQTIDTGTRATLIEANWKDMHKLGKYVKCTATPILQNTQQVGNGLTSTKYFAGIRVVEKHFEVDEAETATIQLELTVPFLCFNTFWVACKLEINLYEPEGLDGQPCPNGEVVQNVVASPCNIKIPAYQGGTVTGGIYHTAEFPILAIGNFEYDGPRKRLIKLNTGANIYHSVWSDYNVDEVTVTIIDKDTVVGNTRCTSNNDPHMKTFDGSSYENQQAGEFVLYENVDFRIRVHTFYQQCNSYATCNCGIAVRVENDLIVLERCQIANSDIQHFGPRRLRLDVDGCDNLGNGFYVYEKNGGYEFQLPTGAKITVTGNWQGKYFNVAVIPSSRDWGKTRGLCGTWNGNCLDDFTLPDDSVVRDDRIGCSLPWTDHPNDDFSLLWRITDPLQSLFGETRTFHPAFPIIPPLTHQYCKCDQTSTAITCDYQRYSLCSVPTNNALVEYLLKKCNKRKKRDLEAMDEIEDEIPVFFYDPTPTLAPTWRNGWTEEKAKQHCMDNIQNSDIGSACNQGVPGVSTDKSVEDCIEDILLSGDTSFTTATLDSFVGQCEGELFRNISIWEPEEGEGEGDGNVTVIRPPKFIADKTCLNMCSGHGTCESGTCVCDEDYVKSDCSLKLSDPPPMYGLIRDGLCQTSQRACISVLVYGEFINSDTLTCHMTYVKVTSSGILQNESTETSIAVYEYAEQVRCVLPPWTGTQEADTHNEGFLVSVSNDGVNKGQEYLFVKYDPDCSTCNTTSQSCTFTFGQFGCANPCLNGGAYMPSAKDDNYDCLCVQGFHGHNCENADKIVVDNNGTVVKVDDGDVIIVEVPLPILIGGVVGGVVLLLIVVVIIVLCCRKSNSRGNQDNLRMDDITKKRNNQKEKTYDNIGYSQEPDRYERGRELGNDEHTYDELR